MSEDSKPTGQAPLYVHVKDWEKHQPRADRPNLPWIRVQTALLGNDAWLDLSPEDTKLLITIWLLVQRYGNGRLRADQAWLMEQAKVSYGPRSRNLERLNHAGFITLSTTKAEPYGGLEERREEPPKGSSLSNVVEGGSAPALNGRASPPTAKNPSPRELDDALRRLDPDDEPQPLRDKRGYLI